jgi:fatty acid synthase subunit alpha
MKLLMGRSAEIALFSAMPEIYYQYEDEIEVLASDETVDVPITATPTAPVTTTTTVSTPSSGPVASMENVPIKAINIPLVIVAQKSSARVHLGS